MIYGVYSAILFGLSWLENFTVMGDKKKKILIAVISFSWLAVSAVRTVAAGDYVSYSGHFYAIGSASLFDTLQSAGHEPLYVALMYLCRLISSNYAFFNFVTYLIVAVLQYVTALQWCSMETGERNHLLSAYFILWCLQFGNIFVVRQTVSAYICLFSIRFIIKRKPGRFLLCVIAASGFHISSILFLLAYPVYKNRSAFKHNFIKMLFYTGGFTASFSIFMKVAIAFLPEKFSARLAMYCNVEKTAKFSSSVLSYGQDVLKGLVNVGVILVVCYLVYRYAKKDEPIKGYVNIYLLSCVFYIASLFYLPVLGRLATPFMFTQIPIFLYSYRLFRSQSAVIWWNGVSFYMLMRLGLSILSEYTAYLPFTTIYSR